MNRFYFFIIFFISSITFADHLNLNWLDRSVKPEQNFFNFANGAWLKNNPIPPEYPSWGTFNILDKKMKITIRHLLEEAQKSNAPAGSIAQKVGDFYFSGMDEQTINKLGVSPLKPEFDEISKITNIAELQEIIPKLHLIGVNAFFNFQSMQDFKNSELMIGVAEQGGLGLPDRDYYINKGEKYQKIREAYVKHLIAMFQLLGDSLQSAQKNATIVMDIETELAKSSLTQIEQRDPYAIYHIKTLAELRDITPNFNWQDYFKRLGYPNIKSINLAMPDFFQKFDTLLTSRSIDDWKIYLRWHLGSDYAPYLSQDFVNQDFKLKQVIFGTQKLLPRWQRVVTFANKSLGFAVGKLYVEKYFTASSKQKVTQIVENIRKALKEDLQNLNWMTPATRQAAIKKLDLMGERVGYPSKWWDYSKLQIDRGPFVLNVKRSAIFLEQRDLNKIGKPIDRTEWHMTPQMINAYYDPSMNNINLPAGILQPPFFDPEAPAALNYGSIGFIIGHEITHGFDDQGAQFDGHGNLKNWWTEEDLKKFKAATNCIVNQFSNYVPSIFKDVAKNGELHVQGKLVVGEAAADLGGVILAYRAYHDSNEFKKAKTIDGFTPDQQFFLGVAHIWASNIRPEWMLNLITTDPHPPAEFRVNGTLANMPEFDKAFAITQVMNQNRCVIW